MTLFLVELARECSGRSPEIMRTPGLMFRLPSLATPGECSSFNVVDRLVVLVLMTIVLHTLLKCPGSTGLTSVYLLNSS